jgi:hypothetical protein
MAIIKNAQLFYPQLDPKYPNARFNKINPTWELQIRTTSKEQAEEWRQLGLEPKLMIYKDGEQEGEPVLNDKNEKQWRVNLRKRSLDSEGKKAPPVKVVNGSLEEINPNTIGIGSIGNVRIYQYEYEQDSEKRLASVLMAVQVTKYIEYVPTRNSDDEFSMEDTEFVPYVPVENEKESKSDTPKKQSTPTPNTPTDDDDEDLY